MLLYSEKDFLMDKSFGIWDQDSAFRQFVYVFMANRWVETFILTCILVQTAFLGLAIPGDMERLERGILPSVKPITVHMDNVFLAIYIVEMLLRMIALGVWKGKHSYGRSNWNLLDGFLVLMSFGHMMMLYVGVDSRDSLATHPSTNGIRIIRCLRPLRTASFVQGVKSAMDHWLFLVHIAILLIFSMVMFGAIGVQLFGGAFSFTCASDFPADEVTNVTTCPLMIQCDSDLCVASPDRPYWGYDNMGQALLSGWIVTTGDMYSPNMITNLAGSISLYHDAAWLFCIMMVLFLQLIVAHLFSAVVVHSFLQESSKGHDAAAIENRIGRQKQVFMRIDHDHSGAIETAELWSVTTILGLTELVSFSDGEIDDAISQMDPDSNGSVDFEEFSHFWSANGPFVVKLKKALKIQEQGIREVWVMVDVDSDNNLGVQELAELGMHLGIKLTDGDVAVMIEEMDARIHGVNYALFCKWWFSDSHVAAKLKRAQIKKNNAPIKMFRRMDRDNDGWITVDDMFDMARVIFGHPLSVQQASDIMEECLQRESTSSVNASDEGRLVGKVSFPVFESWWVSTKPGATEMRHKRQEDIAETQAVLSRFDVGIGGHGDGDLNEQELEDMCRKLKLKQVTGKSVMESVCLSNAEVEDVQIGNFGALMNAEVEEAHREKVTFEEFFDWMRSTQTLAAEVKAAFEESVAREERSKNRPFLFIPGLSPLCRDIAYSNAFDQAMTLIIIISTGFIAGEFHEMEQTHPAFYNILDQSKWVFSSIYCVEFLVKILGSGVVEYFRSVGNCFDFVTVGLFIGGFFVPSIRKATAFRGLRVLVKAMRVVRAARIIAKNEAVMTLLKTILESGYMLMMLSCFACFMLIVLTIVGGHTLGTCHLTDEGQIDPNVQDNLPKLNFYRFSDGFHANFLIMMGESWSGMMFYYQDCTREAWVYFVISYCVMNFFIANLFVALIVDGFCLTAEEKMVKQEKHHLEAVAEQGGIMKAFSSIDGAFNQGTALAGGALDALRGGGAKDLAFGAVKDLPKPQNVMKNMSKGARVQKLTGPMAAMKNEMGRRVPIDLNQMQTLKEKADARVKAAKDEVQKHAELTMRKAQEAAEKAQEASKKAGQAGMAKAREAQELAQALAEERIEEAKKKMEDALADFNGADQELDQFDTMSPEEKKKMMSWNVFALDNQVRRRCIAVIENENWETIVVIIICASSVLIAVDGPPGAEPILEGDPKKVRHALWVLNLLFLLVFWFEFAMKTIADGFIQTPKPYWNDNWNKMDFIALFFSSIEFVTASEDDSPGVARIMRVLRLLRPLRLMKNNESMQVLIDTMQNVVPIMMGVLGMMTIFFTTFAIFGMGLFMGKFYTCNCEGKFGLPENNCTDFDIHKSLNQTACIAQGGTWDNPPYNFDNFFASLRTLYFCSNGGGWIDIIQSGMDVTEVYEAPVKGSSSVMVMYFWAFIIFNRLFVVNVFIGILTNFFLEANGAALLTQPQTAWAQCQIFCLWEKSYMRQPPRAGTVKRWAHDVLEMKFTEPLITFALAVSVISILYESNVRMDTDGAEILGWVEWGTLYFFTAEVLARVLTYGTNAYWRDPWFRLDGVIVFCTWLSCLKYKYETLGVLRSIRILRLLLLARKVKGLRTLTRTLLVSLPGCLNVVILLCLFICIYAVGAMNLFGGIGLDHDTINAFDNFDNFPASFSYLVQMCVAGQDFVNVIYELDNLNQPGAFWFFALFNLTTQWLIINMVVVVLVDNFMKSFTITTMRIQEEHVQQFKEVWCKGKSDPGGLFWGEPFTQGPEHTTIHIKMLEEFVPQLLPPTEVLDETLKHDPLHAFIANQLHHHQNDSPLGLLVPHVIKHKNSTAAPFADGTLAHIAGDLVEIVGRRWNNGMTDDEAAAQGIPPDFVEVNFIESEEMDCKRVVSPEGLHVPPVERFNGFVDGKPATITWVSKDRCRVRVQYTGMTIAHQKVTNKVKLKNVKAKSVDLAEADKPSWMRSSHDDTEAERFTEMFYTPHEEKERDDAAVKIQAFQRGKSTRAHLKRERRTFILARRAEQEAEALQAKLDAEKKVLFVLEVRGRGKITSGFATDTEEVGWLEVGELVDSYECKQTPEGVTRHRIVATRTGLDTRVEGWASERSADGDVILQRRSATRMVKRVSVDEHGAFDEYPATEVMKVTKEGDEQWLNRLALELNITQQEMSDGYRYLPANADIVDDRGRFLPVVVGLRALADGTFVQDIEIGFHELLLALCLISMSYEGLNFEEQQEKIQMMNARMYDYAARVMQCCARTKFAKRHLLKVPQHKRTRKGKQGRPLAAWERYHKRFGILDSYDDPLAEPKLHFVRRVSHLTCWLHVLRASACC
jgi:Ca2+-binding EF-hand superfamily protein